MNFYIQKELKTINCVKNIAKVLLAVNYGIAFLYALSYEFIHEKIYAILYMIGNNLLIDNLWIIFIVCVCIKYKIDRILIMEIENELYKVIAFIICDYLILICIVGFFFTRIESNHLFETFLLFNSFSTFIYDSLMLNSLKTLTNVYKAQLLGYDSYEDN